MAPPFDLLLFHRDLDTSLAYLDQGVDGIIVDLETVGKAERQAGFGTQINDHTLADLRAVSAHPGASVLCRLSSPDANEAELADVLDAGASEIIVPMLTATAQAERICNLVQGACRVTLMVETAAATRLIDELCALPVSRIYVGLNDLRISRRTASIFTPLSDGLLEQLRRATTCPAFGFGGLTLPGHGAPLPVSHLYDEMARLRAGFTFLRRSFYRDADRISPGIALSHIRAQLAAAHLRRPDQVEADRGAMIAALASLLGEAADGHLAG